MSDLYIPVIFVGQQIALPGGGSFGFGHAGFINVNGTTGQASYYEYGRYSGTSGILLEQSIPAFDVSSPLSVRHSLTNVLGLLGEGKNVPVAGAVYDVPSGSFQTIEDYVDPRLNDPNSDLGSWNPANSCYGVVKDIGALVGADVAGDDGLGSTLIPTNAVDGILYGQDGVVVGPDGNVILVKDGRHIFVDGEWKEVRSEADIREALEVEENYCFLPGTPITLADGVTTKPIEEIAPGDEVLSYTDDGTLVPGRVTATSSKTASIVLDWFGLGVTPGHVTLCGVVPGEEDSAAGPFMGQHVPLIDILCADGAVVRQDGSLVRAATNEPVGSRADAFVHLAYSRTGEELKAGVSHEASIRSGTKLITGEGNTVCVLDVIEANGYAFDEETGLVSRPLDDGTPGVPGPLPFFGMPPKPEDHVLARSGTSLEAIHTAGEWEGEGSQLPAPTPARATPPAAMNRKQRRALMAKGRRAH